MFLPIRERFFSKVEICEETGCWFWTGAKTGNGYGSMHFNGNQYIAHRLSYLIEHGSISEGMLICHTCDNKVCVNPDHLFEGTQTDNMRDASLKGRTASGEEHGQGKLTLKDVEAIRLLGASSTYSQKFIGELFGVTRETVKDIVKGKIWSIRSSKKHTSRG